MSNNRELSEEELKALDRNARAGISRSAIEDGDMRTDTMEGKLDNLWHKRGLSMLEERNLPLTNKTLEVLAEWVKEQVSNVTQKRNEIRERNMKLIKQFSKGGRFEGRKLDPRAFFKGDELEEVALEPGGITDAMAMKSSLPTALAYLAFLQKEGHDTFAEIDYTKVLY